MNNLALSHLLIAGQENNCPVVLVRWVDSAGVDGWVNSSDERCQSLASTTLGFLIRQTDSDVVVSGTVADPGGTDRQLNSPIAIPKVAITEMRVLSEPKKDEAESSGDLGEDDLLPREEKILCALEVPTTSDYIARALCWSYEIAEEHLLNLKMFGLAREVMGTWSLTNAGVRRLAANG